MQCEHLFRPPKYGAISPMSDSVTEPAESTPPSRSVFRSEPMQEEAPMRAAPVRVFYSDSAEAVVRQCRGLRLFFPFSENERSHVKAPMQVHVIATLAYIDAFELEASFYLTNLI